MLFDAMARFDARAENCVMVGDKASDIEAGQRAGCSTVWFGKETQDWGATLARILELLEGEATP
jgi:beta-phosphoglucomutase-like phosphatase (HAD superfamily)